MLVFILFLSAIMLCGVFLFLLMLGQDREIRRLTGQRSAPVQIDVKGMEQIIWDKDQKLKQKENEIKGMEMRLREAQSSASAAAQDLKDMRIEMSQLNQSHTLATEAEKQKWTESMRSRETVFQKLGMDMLSMESALNTLALMSKEMLRRTDQHRSKIKLLDERTKENSGLIGQLKA